MDPPASAPPRYLRGRGQRAARPVSRCPLACPRRRSRRQSRPTHPLLAQSQHLRVRDQPAFCEEKALRSGASLGARARPAGSPTITSVPEDRRLVGARPARIPGMVGMVLSAWLPPHTGRAQEDRADARPTKDRGLPDPNQESRLRSDQAPTADRSSIPRWPTSRLPTSEPGSPPARAHWPCSRAGSATLKATVFVRRSPEAIRAPIAYGECGTSMPSPMPSAKI